MTVHSQIEHIYEQYLEEAEKAERERTFADGLFGFGKKPADAPCHTQFIENLQNTLHGYAENQPDKAEIRAILGLVFRMPSEHREPASVYWMLIAAHGTVLELIPLLNAKDTADLQKEYGKFYSRWERLPVQNEVFKALQRAAHT